MDEMSGAVPPDYVKTLLQCRNGNHEFEISNEKAPWIFTLTGRLGGKRKENSASPTLTSLYLYYVR